MATYLRMFQKIMSRDPQGASFRWTNTKAKRSWLRAERPTSAWRPPNYSSTKEAVDRVYLQMADCVLKKRLGQPEEIAKAIAFLAFDATCTTGAELPVDGGWSQS
jgi:NAD(P)-dependent dehydrogenase (short-subunit alcohol dehydrogenase family)